jgi:hypothetical protein
VCREHLPSRLATLESQFQRETGQRGHRGGAAGGDSGSLLAEARRWEEAGDHRHAIETLLKVRFFFFVNSWVHVRGRKEKKIL